MTTTPDTPEEVAENFLGLLRNIVSYTDSWNSFLPAEMRVSAMLCAGVDVTNREFGPGKGAGVVVQFLTEMIRREPAVIRYMTSELAELNTTILAEQARMVKQPAPAPGPKADPITQLRSIADNPAVQACRDASYVLDSIRDYAVEIIDHSDGKPAIHHRVAEILDLVKEGHDTLSLEPNPASRLN